MDGDTSSNPMQPLPQPRPTRWVALFIAVFILIQLLLPLRFYLQTSSADERFAWRMFSYQGMSKCQVSAWDVVERQGERKVERIDLESLTIAYKLENNRPDVVAKFMRWRCEQPGVMQVRFTVQCTGPAGEKLEPVQYWMDRDELKMHEGEPR